MNRKIIGVVIAIAIVIGVIVFIESQKQVSPQVSVGQNVTQPLPPEGKHLQLSINESVGIKTLS